MNVGTVAAHDYGVVLVEAEAEFARVEAHAANLEPFDWGVEVAFVHDVATVQAGAYLFDGEGEHEFVFGYESGEGDSGFVERWEQVVVGLGCEVSGESVDEDAGKFVSEGGLPFGEGGGAEVASVGG